MNSWKERIPEIVGLIFGITVVGLIGTLGIAFTIKIITLLF